MSEDQSYSDGPIEKEIIEILKQSDSLTSDVNIAVDKYSEWPVRYHLCMNRGNLVRHFNFTNLNVIELGAGFGGVSRVIAENAKKFTAVEGTPTRTEGLKARLRDLNHVDIHCCHISDFEIDKKFDVVTLIGVLEYAELFYDTEGVHENSFKALLEKIKSYGEDDHCLLLAIENKLGLKYWAGASEDHLGTYFSGIAGYSDGRSVRTFSKKEIEQLLRSVGYARIDFYYPFPDYKIPSSIVTKDLIDSAPNIVADLVNQREYEDYTQGKLDLFPELLATETLLEAGLLEEFANSFLVLASKAEGSEIRKSLLNQNKKEIGWHYSEKRRVPVKTVFYRANQKPGVIAQKQFMQKNVALSKLEEKIQFNPNMILASSIPADKISLRIRLCRHIHFCEWDQFIEEMSAFVRWSAEKWRVENDSEAIDGRALDATVTNTLVSKHGRDYFLFDQEWEYLEAIKKSWFVTRNLLSLLRDFRLFSNRGPFKCLFDIYVKICADVNIHTDLHLDAIYEYEFQSLVTETKTGKEDYVQHLIEVFGVPFQSKGQ